MASKHLHKTIKEQQHRAVVASLKTKKGEKDMILAPTPMLTQRVILKNGVRGTVREYRGRAGAVIYSLVDEFGTRHDFTREDVLSYK